MNLKFPARSVLFGAAAACSLIAHGADWSDTSIGYRTGSQYAEPFNSKDISKDIINLNHVSGYKTSALKKLLPYL